MMTLDGAIKHAEEVAEEQDELCKRYDDASGYSRSHNESIRVADAKWCERCAKEHRQLAEWLRDYKRLKEQKPCEDAELEKHTDRQIYDGCILLMQKMVDYFQEYLDYLGYDLGKLDEDERFAVGMSNMEIVRQLFLYQTRNSGGCSTRDFCEKLGVDPYDSFKFEFEESEEE